MRLKRPLFFISLLHSLTVLATELDTMTVSDARLTNSSFNTEPVSKNELNQQEFIERGINNIETVSQQISNLHLTNNGVGSYGQKIALRGLTNTALYSARCMSMMCLITAHYQCQGYYLTLIV
jgi:hypothetical protein